MAILPIFFWWLVTSINCCYCKKSILFNFISLLLSQNIYLCTILGVKLHFSNALSRILFDILDFLDIVFGPSIVRVENYVENVENDTRMKCPHLILMTVQLVTYSIFCVPKTNFAPKKVVYYKLLGTQNAKMQCKMYCKKYFSIEFRGRKYRCQMDKTIKSEETWFSILPFWSPVQLASFL